MTAINTNLTTSGNSVAVRLPKELLRMSGLGHTVKLEAKQGKIIISKLANPRAGWASQIKKEIASQGLPNIIDDYGNLQSEAEATLADGLA